MFKPDSPMRSSVAAPRSNHSSGPALPAAALGMLLLLQLPAAATAAALAITEEPPPSVERSAPATKTPPDKAASGYRLRCWQHGRLLFEEDDIALPPDGSRYALRLAGHDRDGRPLYVAETLNATCLVRHAPAVRVNPALPR